MHTQLGIAFVLASTCAAQPSAVRTDDRAALASAVDAFLQDRWSSVEPAELVARLRASKVDADELEAILRAGRPRYPKVREPRGKLSARMPLPSDYVDHATEHYVYVPATYDHATAASLVVIGHGGSAARNLDFGADAARGGMQPFWLQAADKHGFLVLAPLTDRGWMQIGTSLLFSAISRMQRDFHVDPDRIYLTGHSMGGHLTWRSAFWFPDRWAAVSPMSGGYDYVKSQDVWNLIHVPGYTTFGTKEPYQIAEFNRIIAAWMKDHAYPWTCREKNGGHEIYPDEVAKVAAFFAKQRRNLYAPRLWARVGGLRFSAAETNPQWQKAHTWNTDRPIELSTVHWLRFFDLPAETPADRRVQRVHAECKDNHIELVCEHVAKLRVYLHPRLVKFGKPVTIRANGKQVFAGIVQPDLATMLTVCREFDDRGRVFHAAVDIDVEGDHPVPEPRGTPGR